MSALPPLTAALGALALVLPQPALADGSSFTTEGVTIRLVAEAPDADGRVRGAVLFDLQPGWKTYWIDPGESGIAPVLDFAASTGIAPPTLDFPAPERLDEGGIGFNGYDAPMAIAFETRAEPDSGPHVSLDLFAGICRDICVPVSTMLTSEPAGMSSVEDAAIIDRAFLALPPVEKANGATAQLEGDELVIAGLSVEGPAKDLFISGPPGWQFGPPHASGPRWRAAVRAQPSGETAPSSINAVLVDGAGARRFVIDIP
jgi:DsbC/DsbD-like thiol-disulfide interchange protein